MPDDYPELPRIRLEQGEDHPYDAGVPQGDWAHRAARGVCADLCDRRGIKWAMQPDGIDEETTNELVATMAKIIRLARQRSLLSEEPDRETRTGQSRV